MEKQLRVCLSVMQKGIWYNLQKEKLITEFNTYTKIEYLRMNERLLSLAQEFWKEGKDFYNAPSGNKGLSVE